MPWGLSYIYYAPKVHGWQGTCYCSGHPVVGAPKCTFTIQGEEADEELLLRKTKHWLNGAPHYATRSDHMKKWGTFVRKLDASQVPDDEQLEKDKFTEDATMPPTAAPHGKRGKRPRLQRDDSKRKFDATAPVSMTSVPAASRSTTSLPAASAKKRS